MIGQFSQKLKFYIQSFYSNTPNSFCILSLLQFSLATSCYSVSTLPSSFFARDRGLFNKIAASQMSKRYSSNIGIIGENGFKSAAIRTSIPHCLPKAKLVHAGSGGYICRQDHLTLVGFYHPFTCLILSPGIGFLAGIRIQSKTVFFFEVKFSKWEICPNF